MFYILLLCLNCKGGNKVWYDRSMCDAFRNLVPFVLFKKYEKHSWRSVNFSKITAESCKFTKSNTPPWVFFTFLKLCKWHQIAQSSIND